jgi:hypothetical protein
VRSRVAAAVAGVALSIAARSFAARPLDTEDTGTVAVGHVELELGASFARDAAAGSALLGGVVSAGVSRSVEARVESGLRIGDDGSAPTRGGVADTLLGLKWRWIRETLAGPAVLAGFTLRVPTSDADRGLGTEGFDPGALLAVSRVFGDFQTTANAGYTIVGDDRGLDYWTATAALEWAATRATVAMTELVGTIGADEADDVALGRLGIVHAWSPSLKVDGAVAAGLTEPSPDFVLTIGVTLALF